MNVIDEKKCFPTWLMTFVIQFISYFEDGLEYIHIPRFLVRFLEGIVHQIIWVKLCCDRYILEGKELEFYMKKIQRKKGKGSAA